MIKVTKNNVVEIIRERMAKITIIKHSESDSYDSDLIVYGNPQKRIDKNLVFIDVSDDETCLVGRKRWQYNSEVKLKSISLPISDMCRDNTYYHVSVDDYFKGYTTLESLKDEIRRRINIVIKILNFMSKNNIHAMIYEVFVYIKSVVENFEKLLNLKII